MGMKRKISEAEMREELRKVRKRMSTYTPEQRHKLWLEGMKIVNAGKKS